MKHVPWLGIVVLVLLLGSIASAERHGACSRCGRWVVLSKEGAGFVRDWKGLCGRCKLLQGFEEFARENELPSDTVGRFGIEESNVAGIRYLHFEDGTIIDLKHFMAAADTALVFGEVLANVLGWMKEVQQWANDEPSGHPFGGNEDLRSNLDGADFGDEHVSDDSDQNVGEQITDYLESEHGEITQCEYEKKPDRRQDGADVDDDEDD